jgi:DNA polymerase-3 subunit beta
MEFQVNSAILSSALKAVTQYMGKTLMAGSVHFRAQDGAVRLSATDFMTSAVYKMDVEGVTDGEVLLPKIVADMAAKLPAGDVHVKSDGERTVFDYGSGRFESQQMDAAAFPVIEIPADTAEVSGAVFAEMARRTLFAADAKIDGPLGSVRIEHGDTLKFICTDSHRLAVSETAVKPAQYAVTVPITPVKNIARMAKDSVKIGVAAAKIAFTCGPLTVMSRLIDAKYPDWQRVLPKESTTTVIVDAGQLSEAVSRAYLLTNEHTCMRLRVAAGEIAITAIDEKGKVRETIPVEMTGADIEIAVNARYVLDALDAAAADTVRMEMSGKFSPILFRTDASEDWSLALPLRV